MRRLLPLGAAVLVIAAAFAFADVGADAGPATQEDRVQEIASALRCPVCQNLSVADSPSRLAGEMRTEIASRLDGGASPDEVRAYFVERYGEWVLLEPRPRGLNLIPWLAPIAGLVAGGAIWLGLVRRRQPESAEEPV